MTTTTTNTALDVSAVLKELAITARTCDRMAERMPDAAWAFEWMAETTRELIEQAGGAR